MNRPNLKSEKLHLGCGLTAPSDWLNVDGSWQATLVRFPYIRQGLGFLGLMPRKQAEIPWSNHILRLNVKKPLPFRNHSFAAIYSSHLLEHLHRKESLQLLKECHRILKSGGVCRAVVPDLEYLAREYIKAKGTQKNSSEDFARKFLRSTHLSSEAPVSGSFFYHWYQKLTDFHTHKWMYDKESLTLLFEEAGFRDAGPKNFQESKIEDIEKVEQRDRVENGAGICVEGIK